MTSPMRMAYDPGLTERLVQGHRHLRTLFEQVAQAAEAEDEAAFRAGVHQCEQALESHFTTEKEQLYAYLRQVAQNDPELAQKVAHYDRELGNIGRNIQTFLGDYIHHPAPVLNFEIARLDLRDLRALLRERVQREEAELYPLYEQASSSR